MRAKQYAVVDKNTCRAGRREIKKLDIRGVQGQSHDESTLEMLHEVHDSIDRRVRILPWTLMLLTF